MNKPKSQRQLLAERIAVFLLDNHLCQVFGGDVFQKNRYYSVSFSIKRTLDGEIRVYSPKFIQVLCEGPAAWVSSGSDVFESEDDVLQFLRYAFVEHKPDLAQQIPRKVKKT